MNHRHDSIAGLAALIACLWAPAMAQPQQLPWQRLVPGAAVAPELVPFVEQVVGQGRPVQQVAAAYFTAGPRGALVVVDTGRCGDTSSDEDAPEGPPVGFRLCNGAFASIVDGRLNVRWRTSICVPIDQASEQRAAVVRPSPRGMIEVTAFTGTRRIGTCDRQIQVIAP